MSEIPLNKFEKEKKVIELHKQGKTIKQIAPEVHKIFRDISKHRKERKNYKIKEKRILNQIKTSKKIIFE